MIYFACSLAASLEATSSSNSVPERLVEGHGYRDSGSRLEMWTCILLLSGDPANNCLETFQVPATHAALWQLLFIVICVVCLFRTNSYETLVYKASQSALRNLNAKLRALYNLGASLIAWLANPFSGGPYWCHFPSGFAEWAVSIYAILTVWCIMAGFWLHLRESGKAKPKTAQAGIRATVEVKQAPGTPTAGGGSNSNKAHHSNQSPPADAGDAAGGLVQTAREERRKEKKRVNRQKAAAAKKAAAELAAAGIITASSADQPGQASASNPAEPAVPAEPMAPAEPADGGNTAGRCFLTAQQQRLMADLLSSEPQQGNSAAGPPVPAMPAAHAVPAEATPAVPQSPPAAAGDVAGGLVQTAREARRKEQKRVNRQKAAAAKKAAADLAAAGSITASSADQPGQEKKRMNRQKAAARKAAADLAAAGSITASSADQPGQANGFGGSTVNFTGSVEAAHHDFGADSQKASHQGSLQPDSQKATRQGSIQPGSQGVSAAAASQEVLTAAPKSKMTGPARSSLAQKQLKPGVNSFKLKVPAIKSPDDTGPAANANRSSVPAVQAGADASTKQQQSVTRKKDRVAAPGSSHRRQPGGGSKGRAPAAKRGALLPGPSHQQHPSAGNRSSVSDVSKAAPQHTTAAPPAEHSQSKAGVQSSHAHARSKAHSVARPAAQKQPPTAAWKTRSQSAAQRPTSNTALLSSGDPTSNPQPPQPGQGPSGPMSYAKAAGKGLPQKQHTLLVRDRVPMDSLVVPYLSRERDSAEEQQAKKQVYDSLMELATGQHQIRSCRHIAGDGNCGYRAVMVGLIEGAYASATFKRWLLASLPKGLGGIRRFGFAKGGRGAQDCPINQGFHQLMALVENTNNLSLDSLIGECRLEQAADCKLLFIRAAMAAGLMQSEQALWPQIQAAVEGADKSRCQGLAVGQFCRRYILPMVNWGDGETTGLR
ncbi:hypothetical protein WJX79_006599 [Trebouxia sp. C0005]